MTKIEEVLGKLGIESLNDMQMKTGRALMTTDSDVVVLSATGSGKTLAYLLPLVGMINPDRNELQAVVIVPGRELALQSDGVLKRMGCGVRSMPLYGGRAAMDEHKDIKKMQPQVVFATPGRLIDHIDKGNITAATVRYLVIDEFDKCLQMGFRDEMQNAVRRLRGVRRRILLSATDAEEIPDFVNMGEVTRIDCLEESKVSDRISLFVVKSPEKDKLDTLYKLLCSFGESSSIVFLNYRDSVERVADYLTEKGFIVSRFRGGMEQKEREDAIYKFANGSANVLVCTDLASRGLDVPDVDNIVHYHLPVGEDEYVHRIGRTARWKSSGRAFFLLGPDEVVPGYVNDEPQPYTVKEDCPTPPSPRMVTLYIGKGKKDKISRGDVLGFLCKTGGMKGSDIGRIDVKERCAYAAVSRDRYKEVLRRTAGEKLKGIKTIVELIK